MKILNTILCVVIIALLFITLTNLNALCVFIKSGQHLMGDKVVIDIGDVTWGKLPPTMREEISKMSAPTKFDDKDLRDLIAYYQKLLDNYKEPFSLKTIEK